MKWKKHDGDTKDGKRTARRLAIQASAFIELLTEMVPRNRRPRNGQKGSEAWEEAQEMQDEWGEMSETEQRQPDTRWIPGIEYED
jgi:hypothetical protein